MNEKNIDAVLAVSKEILSENEVTMSSREIAELCSKQHRNVKRDILKLLTDLGEDVLKFEHIYLDTNNRKQTEYLLNKEICFCLVAGYNAQFRLNIVRRWLELESSVQKQVPTNFADALRNYADEVEEHNRTKEVLKEACALLDMSKPKVKYHDVVLQCEDLMTITQISQDYPISNQKLNKILAEEGIQYKDKSGIWYLYVQHGNQGYAQTVTHTYEVNGKRHAKLHLKWTQKGRLFIYDTLKARGILPICEQED